MVPEDLKVKTLDVFFMRSTHRCSASALAPSEVALMCSALPTRLTNDITTCV